MRGSSFLNSGGSLWLILAGWTSNSILFRRSFKIGLFALICFFLVVFAAYFNSPVLRHPSSPLSDDQSTVTPHVVASGKEKALPANTPTVSRPLPPQSYPPPHSASPTPFAIPENSIRKPPGLKIVAVIFYGRPDRVEILDCYLKRNLVANRGWIDEVYWVSNTKNQNDLNWLDKLLPTSPLYKKISPDTDSERKGYARLWDSAVTEPDTLYLKIDDDIVYIDDHAIPKLVSLKLESNHSFIVSANVVNGAPLSYHHYRTEAIRPYLPELTQPNDTSLGTPTWRASQLPPWEGPDDFEFPLGVGTAPYPNHRWLPLRHGNRSDIYRTPIQHSLCSPWKEVYGKWSLAAQQHFSFFESLEQNATDVYDFARRGVWNMGFERISINFIAVWGKDIIDHLPLVDDEAMLTKSIPRRLNRPVLVATGALASHYAFTSQVEDLKNTDILSRYRAYANELVCPGTLI
ncbi:hypothetical protein ACO22_07178 [Paracoccidioides brasiliensis]|uniref:Uncharacterized protein n=1 Tax=Paracoccidioides brasiliensis TaxID=121759 RepID=A0A1D2J5J0_PARBR|nr:hypothetical protein ACO22_07178 [Paracoccidioides brasiliensis]